MNVLEDIQKSDTSTVSYGGSKAEEEKLEKDSSEIQEGILPVKDDLAYPEMDGGKPELKTVKKTSPIIKKKKKKKNKKREENSLPKRNDRLMIVFAAIIIALLAVIAFYYLDSKNIVQKLLLPEKVYAQVHTFEAKKKL